MRNNRNLYKWIFPLFLIFISCEKVVTLDLESSEPQIVIDAVITDEIKPHFVKLSKSGDFYNPSIFPTVSDAQIIIFDDFGFTDTLKEVEDGLYQSSPFAAKSEYEYSIDVQVNGQQYQGHSLMPVAMEIDSISFKPALRGPKSEGKFYEVHVYFKNRPGIPDFARVKIYQNGELQPGYYLYSDQYSDGKVVDFFFFGGSKIELNDSIKIELLSIDELTYDYYSTLAKVIASTEGGGGPTGDVSPANPETNLSNHALGYFAAYAVRRDSAIVK